MNPVIAVIKASRWKNLLFIVLTMVLVREGIIYPFFEILTPDLKVDLLPGLSNMDCVLGAIAAILIGAAGNLINDYFDIKIDRVNKPDKIIVGRYVKRRVVMMLHVVFNSIALAITAYISYKIGVIELTFIPVILIVTLWFYSTDFKRRMVWGNLSIGFCAALLTMVVWIFEILAMIQYNKEIIADEPEARAFFMEYSMVTLAWVGGLSIFSFLMTVAREITKDIVDIKGDEAMRCKTMPIVLGIPKTKMIINTIYILVLLFAIYIQQVYLNDRNTLLYLFFVVAPLILASIVTTFRANATKDFKLPSNLNKLASLAGVLYLVIVYFILKQ